MRQKGNFVVDTGVPPEDTYRQIDAHLLHLRNQPRCFSVRLFVDKHVCL